SEFKHLQPVVPGINRYHTIPLVHRNSPRISQLSRLPAGAAPDRKGLAGLLVDLLHAIISELAYDKISLAILIQPIRKPKFARRRPGSAEVAHERAVGFEHANAMIAGIGHID